MPPEIPYTPPSRWYPLLAWLPIEEVIRSRLQSYDESLGRAGRLLRQGSPRAGHWQVL